MAKFIVIAYAANASGKTYRAHQIFDETKITPEEKADLVKRKFIREATKEEMEANQKLITEQKKAAAAAKDLE